MKPKQIAALHDLSCLGRCALTVILPTLSVMGYQVVPVPTALLSTHTGGYTDMHFRDLTDDMEEIARHFGELGTTFSSVYTGFLGSTRQIETVERFLRHFGSHPDVAVLVDPVMGDEGALYSTYTGELASGMRRLSHHANILTPNLTEACFLTDTPYLDTAGLSEDEAMDYANGLMDRLEAQYPCRLVITGICFSDGGVGNLGRDADGSRFTVRRPHEGRSYPGTGDVFASVLLGSLLDGKSFADAVAHAADFIALLIRESSKLPTPAREGVALEPQLWRLAKQP